VYIGRELDLLLAASQCAL